MSSRAPEGTPPPQLRRALGLSATVAIVVGNMLGTGVFFAPGEVAAIASEPWTVYTLWVLSGTITLCAALTLSEIASRLPQAGASYQATRTAFGPFWGFMNAWMHVSVAGPASVAGVAIAFGEYVARLAGGTIGGSPALWGSGAILFFAAVNLAGVAWGGTTQTLLTAFKAFGVLALVGGSAWLAAPHAAPAAVASEPAIGSLATLVRTIGLGVAAVLFTYDGWLDIAHVAGEVREPERTLPRALGLGVGAVTILYVAVNHAFLRVVPLEAMRAAPTTVAATVAQAAFGPAGGQVLTAVIVVAAFGALGGLVLTLPRLFFAVAHAHRTHARGPVRRFLTALSTVTPGSSTPSGAIVYTALMSVAALVFFGSFARLVNYLIVPMHVSNILTVSTVFALRARMGPPSSGCATPGYPWTPLVFIGVISLFLLSAVYYQPVDTLIGVGLAATGAPIYASFRGVSGDESPAESPSLH